MFFQNLKTRQREGMVKDNLTKELNTAIKDVQLNKVLHDNDCFVTSDDAGKSLVTVLEGIFVHGVRETFAEKLSSAFGDLDRKPTPEFWSPMMIFTHRDTISQINSLTQISTDVGRSRSWIRLSLNEGLFLGYLHTLSQEMKALKPYYKNTAYLLDQDRLNIAINYFQGLSQFRFRFPINSSVLNQWPDETLLIAGLWTAALKLCPVSSGMDVVKCLPDDELAEPASEPSMSTLSPFPKDIIDEQEAFEAILNTPTDGSPMQSRMNIEADQIGSEMGVPNEPGATAEGEYEDQSERVQLEDNVEEPPLAFDEPPKNELPSETSAVSKTLESYDSILNEYLPTTTVLISEPELELEKILIQYETQVSDPGPLLAEDKSEDFESEFIIVEKPSSTSASADFKYMVNLLRHGKIVQELGLGGQNFSCKNCNSLIGPTTVKARVCSLSGFYYCGDCFKNSEFVIPSRIIHNWDFAKYSVSPESNEFLNLIYMHPLINIRTINPRIYFAVEEMHIVHKLRLILNHLRQYLFTCHDSTKNRLQNLLWPREYLYEHVHLYSIMDLMEAASGTLMITLKKAVQISESHVRSCTLCSQKGFLCELCRNTNNSTPQPIFPFDVDNVYRCAQCQSIYHKECMKTAVHGCPKCGRIKLRKTRILLDEN